MTKAAARLQGLAVPAIAPRSARYRLRPQSDCLRRQLSDRHAKRGLAPGRQTIRFPKNKDSSCRPISWSVFYRHFCAPKASISAAVSTSGRILTVDYEDLVRPWGDTCSRLQHIYRSSRGSPCRCGFRQRRQKTLREGRVINWRELLQQHAEHPVLCRIQRRLKRKALETPGLTERLHRPNLSPRQASGGLVPSGQEEVYTTEGLTSESSASAGFASDITIGRGGGICMTGRRSSHRHASALRAQISSATATHGWPRPYPSRPYAVTDPLSSHSLIWCPLSRIQKSSKTLLSRRFLSGSHLSAEEWIDATAVAIRLALHVTGRTRSYYWGYHGAQDCTWPPWAPGRAGKPARRLTELKALTSPAVGDALSRRSGRDRLPDPSIPSIGGWPAPPSWPRSRMSSGRIGAL